MDKVPVSIALLNLAADYLGLALGDLDTFTIVRGYVCLLILVTFIFKGPFNKLHLTFALILGLLLGAGGFLALLGVFLKLISTFEINSPILLVVGICYTVATYYLVQAVIALWAK